MSKEKNGGGVFFMKKFSDIVIWFFVNYDLI